MTQSIMFAGQQQKETVRSWCDKFRSKIRVATEDAVVTTSFGATHALVAGPVDAPPLVLLHGALACSAHALPELGPLLHTRRVYALDIVGQSPWSEDRRIDVKGDSYGRWLVETCDGLGLDKYDLYGVSWGGFVALRGAIAAPERVRHLVLLVPAGFVANSPWAGLREVGWPLLMYRAFPSSARLDRVVRALFTTPDPDWTAYFGDALLCYRLDMRVPPIATPEELATIRCPTLIFGGEGDVHFPGRALIDRATKLVPQAEGELLEGSKHCPPTTDEFRARMATRIQAFLDR